MERLNGVYEGRIVSLGNGNATAFVPQVFGDTTIIVSDFLAPAEVGRGWVVFQAGDPEFPVWLSGSSSGDGKSGFTYVQDTAPTATTVGETWWNSSTSGGGGSYVAIDRGDGVLVWVQTAPPSSPVGLTYPTFIWSNYTGDWSTYDTFSTAYGKLPIDSTGTNIVSQIPDGWTVGSDRYLRTHADGLFSVSWYWEKVTEGTWDNYVSAGSVQPPELGDTYPTAGPTYAGGAWGFGAATLKLYDATFGFICIPLEGEASIYSTVTVTRLDA